MKVLHITFKTVTAIIIMLACIKTTAQEKSPRDRSPQEISDKQTEFIAEKLELNQKEKQQLKAINLKYANEIKALSAEERSRENREKLEKLNHEHNAEVKTVLNEEDFGEYLVLKKRMHERMRMQMKERHIEANYKANKIKREQMQHRKAFMETLDLNEAQSKQLMAIKEAYRAKHEAIRAEGRTEETRQKLEALRKAQNKEVKSVLNEEQYTLYLEMQEKRKENMRSKRSQKRG